MASRKLDIFLLIIAVAVTRFVFRSHYFYDLDSVNFTLGMKHFAPRIHQPHPPGYFLYVCLGRLLHFFIHDANLALVMLSIVASCGLAVLIYEITSDWFDQSSARFAGALFVISPLAWFYGTVALTYSVEAFFSALVGYLCWRVCRGHAAYIVPAAIALGISAGVRPPSIVFLGPLFLFSLYKVSAKGRLAGISVLTLTLLGWFLPMLAASGGFEAYFNALFSLWRMVPSKDTVYNSSPSTSINRLATIMWIYFVCFGAASLAPMRWLHRSLNVDRRKKVFTLVWVIPALCFFTFIFLKFVSSGYLLLLSAPACIWLGFLVAGWYRDSARSKVFKLAVMAFCAAVNVGIFVASPLYCSYLSVRRYEADLQSIRTVLPQIAPASNTLIIGFDSHFLGFRHAGYYLPGYLTLEYPEVKLAEGTRIFAMKEQETQLLPRLPTGPYSQFVFFPLRKEDNEYLQMVLGSLSNRNLRTVSAGGQDFIIGPISDLPLLFPDAAAAPK